MSSKNCIASFPRKVGVALMGFAIKQRKLAYI